MTWWKSPSGWPVYADTGDEQAELQARGYVALADDQVQPAVDAFRAAEAAPASTQLPGWALATDVAASLASKANASTVAGKQDKSALDADVATKVGTAGSATATALRAAFGLSVAATVSANATLAVNKHTPVDATSGTRTMTLPTGQAEGTRVIVEKVDPSLNAVTVSGSIRGTAGSVSLVGQYESMSFLADSGGSWHPGPSHKTKGWLDTSYGTPALWVVDTDAKAAVRSLGIQKPAQNTSAFRAGYVSLASVNDYREFDVPLVAGAWVLSVETLKADGGTMKIEMDGVQVAVVDTYSTTGTTAAVDVLPVVTVTTPGTKRFRFTLTSKNTSATVFTSRLSGFLTTRVRDAKVPAAPLTWTRLATDFEPDSIGTDGVVYGRTNADKRRLARSSDGGQTLELGRNIGEYTISGEYTIWSTRTTAGYIAVTSSDVGVAGNFGGIYFCSTFTGTYTKVQTIKGTNQFSFSKPVTGPNGQTWLAFGEYSTDMPQPAHVLWFSSDGGQTWKSIKTAVNIDTTKNSHFHGCAFDTSRGVTSNIRLWVSQGDNQNSWFGYTDNPNATTPSFTEVPLASNHPLYNSEAGSPQPVTVISWPERLVTSPDRAPAVAGLWKMDPAVGAASTELAWVVPRGESAPNHFGRSPYVQSGSVAVVIVPDRFSTTKKAYIVGTGDSGLTWHLLDVADMNTSGSVSQGIVGPDSAGLIYWKSQDNALPWGTNLHVAPLPTWRTPPQL